MKKSFLVIALIALSSCCLFTSCVTGMILGDVISSSVSTSKYIEQFEKDYAEFNPSNSAIIYDYGIGYIDLAQQNPKLGYDIISSCNYGSGNVCLSYPVPLKSQFAIRNYRYTAGNTIYTVYGSIQGIDIEVTKPGLIYVGLLSSNKTYELKATKDLLKYLKGTEWEEVINKRIQELSNEK